MFRIIGRQCTMQFRRPFASATGQTPNLSCPACKSKNIQIREDVFCCKLCPNRQGVDYFRLFGLPRVYDLDIKTAESSYRELQKTVHPDRIDVATEHNTPEGFSSLLNKAIKVLKSPVDRAMHLLFLVDGCSIKESDLTNDSTLLMEMMEINEEVEECGRDKACLERQSVVSQQRLHECDEELKRLFADRKYAEIRKVCEKMHFLERVKDTLLQKLNSA